MASLANQARLFTVRLPLVSTLSRKIWAILGMVPRLMLLRHFSMTAFKKACWVSMRPRSPLG